MVERERLANHVTTLAPGSNPHAHAITGPCHEPFHSMDFLAEAAVIFK
jgi:hypothetical protein